MQVGKLWVRCEVWSGEVCLVEIWGGSGGGWVESGMECGFEWLVEGVMGS